MYSVHIGMKYLDLLFSIHFHGKLEEKNVPL